MKTTEISSTETPSMGDERVLGDVISEERAKELIKELMPWMKGRYIEIDHIGEYDKDGCKHWDAICVIQFNTNQQITIWNKGIQCYDGGRKANDTVLSCGPNTFNVYRMLHSWGLVS
ncbi:MAG: hypothetical protein ABJG41_09980 [Cyclobacteriaceae bacterium]